MCGIFFYITKDFIRRKKHDLEARFSNIQHRGPNASRVRYYNEDAMIGFHRLAIVDPTAAGMQPFEEDRFICVVNGEIYNYQELLKELQESHPESFEQHPLTSHSDCEIVLHLFRSIIGKEQPTLDHAAKLARLLDGEFAFIIYDTLTHSTFYGVDELRARPLYINHHDDEIYLASEQKAFIRPNYSTTSFCVLPVESGTVGMIVKSGSMLENIVQKYYDFESIRQMGVKYPVLTFEQSTEKLRKLIISNIRRKLNPEREFGFLLSGGLDSSLICGISAQLLAPHRIRTFTVGFDKNASDVVSARKVAAHINSIHTEFIFTYADGIALLRDVIYNNESWDQTTTRASVPMLLLLRAIKKQHPEMAVIYSGEMADELFMGYYEWQKAPTPTDARNHVIKRLEHITYFDGLRADRTVCSVGCELRVPFFGKDILDFTLHSPPEYFMPQSHNGVEKFMLRSAFGKPLTVADGPEFPEFSSKTVIPNEILWRTKHAFSDATSIVGKSSWKEALRAHADKEITDSRFNTREKIYQDDAKFIQTKEDMLYWEIFTSFDYAPRCIPYKWMPNWAPPELTDASATALAGFTESRL